MVFHFSKVIFCRYSTKHSIMINVNDFCSRGVFAVLLFCFLSTTISAQCISGINITTKAGETELRRCSRQINFPDIVRFTTQSVPTPVAYVVTDLENKILLVSLSSKMDLTNLGAGEFRVWAFSYAGQVQAEIGENVMETNLGSICGALSNNYVTLENFAVDACFTIQFLHSNDNDSKLLNGGEGLEDIGGVARFKRRLDGLRSVAFLNGWSSILLSAGGSIAPGLELDASLNLENGEPYYDAIAMQKFAYDAIGFGHHDFDLGPNILAQFINDFGTENVPPFISSNLNFEGESRLQELVLEERIRSSKIVFRASNAFGVIAVTAPDLASISNPGNVTASEDLAQLIQAEVFALQDQGYDKIILLSHLGDLSEERALVNSLRGIDVIIAGGGKELLTNKLSDALDGQEIEGEYPLKVKDADEKEVLLVTTPGEYRYVGQLILTFNPLGEIALVDPISGPVLIETDEPDQELIDLVIDPVTAYIEGLELNNLTANDAGFQVEYPTNYSNKSLKLKAFPNPTQGQINLTVELELDSKVSVVVSNLLGQNIWSNSNKMLDAGFHNLQLDLSNLAPGTYFVTLKANDTSNTVKVVKRG